MIKGLIKVFAKIYSPQASFRLRDMRNAIYSIWVRGAFARIGASAYISRPFYLKGGRYVEVGERFIAGYRTRIEAWDSYAGQHYTPLIVLGDNVCLNFDCHIGAINRIEIGNNVLIGSRVSIVDHNHGDSSVVELHTAPIKRTLYSKGPITIKDNVWLCENVVVLPGVTIGENTVVAANSVVTDSLPANCIAGGIPARVIKQH